MRVLTKDGKPILVDGKMICVDEVTQISDVTVNGASVVNADGVAEIPLGNQKTIGVTRFSEFGFYTIGDTTYLRPIPPADFENRQNATASYKVITLNNLDYAVKKALSDGKGAEYTEAEKKASCERIGAEREKGEWVLKGTITTENKGNGIIVDLSGCTEIQVFSHVVATGIAHLDSYSPSASNFMNDVGVNGERYVETWLIDSVKGISPISSKYGLNARQNGNVYNGAYARQDGIHIKDITKFAFSNASVVTECNIEIYAR